MADDSKAETPGLTRRGLVRRLGLSGVGGVAVAVGLTFEAAPAAQAQGYPPMPPPQYERPPPPPPPHYVWQPGHWRWNGFRYVWFAGRYVMRGPGYYGHFVPGHWGSRGGQWVWIPQHWQ